jgi:hypothetical protein
MAVNDWIVRNGDLVKKIILFIKEENYYSFRNSSFLSDNNFYVPTLADRGCRLVSATNPHGR